MSTSNPEFQDVVDTVVDNIDIVAENFDFVNQNIENYEMRPIDAFFMLMIVAALNGIMPTFVYAVYIRPMGFGG